jgi:hypothetical protein
VSSLTQGANGSVTLNDDGTLTYTLTRFFSGADTFTYTVSDGRGGTSTGVVTVQVQVPPSQGIDLVKSQVGTFNLNEGQENSLTSKLQAAQQSLARGNVNATVNQLDAFIDEIQALKRSERLDAALSRLIAAAPQDGELFLQRGQVRVALGQAAAAKQDFENALSLSDSLSPGGRVKALVALNQWDTLAKQYAQA